MKINSRKVYSYVVAAGSMIQGLCLSVLVDGALKKVDCPKVIKGIGRTAASGMIASFYTALAAVAVYSAKGLDFLDDDEPSMDDIFGAKNSAASKKEEEDPQL